MSRLYMVLWVIAATILGAGAGILFASYFPWFRRPASTNPAPAIHGTVKLYSPVILRGTLWVASGVLVVMLKTLLEWKSTGRVEEIDLKILWVGVAATAVDKWLTFMDTTVARFRDQKKLKEEEETTRQRAQADFGVKG